MSNHLSSLVIITGVSRGLGEALALYCLSQGQQVIGIGRHYASSLDTAISTGQFRFLQLDLQTLHNADLGTLLQDLPLDYGRYILINNAGIVEPIVQAEQIDSHSLDAAFKVNVYAPILLCAEFIRTIKTLNVPTQILNISSGAGRKGVSGWGVYCASKAALDRYTESLANQLQNTNIKAVALAPGVIDTAMQEQIRQSNPESFPDLARFVALKAQNKLSSTQQIARAIYDYLNRRDFGQIIIDDIRHYF